MKGSGADRGLNTLGGFWCPGIGRGGVRFLLVEAWCDGLGRDRCGEVG